MRFDFQRNFNYWTYRAENSSELNRNEIMATYLLYLYYSLYSTFFFTCLTSLIFYFLSKYLNKYMFYCESCNNNKMNLKLYLFEMVTVKWQFCPLIMNLLNNPSFRQGRLGSLTSIRSTPIVIRWRRLIIPPLLALCKQHIY